MRKLGFVAACFTVFLTGIVPAHAAFPGANGKIAFWSTRDDANGEIYSVNPDGSGLQRLTNNAVGDLYPVWSPDGSKIAFTRGTFQESDLLIMNADGSGQTGVTSEPGADRLPAWSPDGSKLAFERQVGSVQEIYSVNADGSGLTHLTPEIGYFDGEPAWSPDGSRIAFSRYTACCVKQIWIMNANGSGKVNLSSNAESDRFPDWSPDGHKILFARAGFIHPDTGSSFYDLFTMNSDGTGQALLTSGGTEASWSPDGTKVTASNNESNQACPSACGPDVPVVVMNADGSNRTPIVASGVNVQPDWQPLRALDPFPRPGGATPLRVPLVPVYAQCTNANSEHVAPLSSPSCTPPAPLSSLLTTSSTGKGQGHVRFDVQPGDPLTGTDEADVAIQASISDVRNTSDGSDYAGKLILNATLRITDRASGFGGVSATTGDFGFSMPLDCLATPDPAIGGACNLQTTLDTLLPGTAKEGRRAVIASRLVQMLDVGADGQIASSGCPPTCGTGDEQPFVRQGVFTP